MGNQVGKCKNFDFGKYSEKQKSDILKTLSKHRSATILDGFWNISLTCRNVKAARHHGAAFSFGVSQSATAQKIIPTEFGPITASPSNPPVQHQDYGQMVQMQDEDCNQRNRWQSGLSI